MVEKVGKEKRSVEVDSETIIRWRNLAYEIYDELPEVDEAFKELIGWREARNKGLDIGSAMGVIRRAIMYTSKKAEKLKDEICEFTGQTLRILEGWKRPI